jgi:hypothetical protein
VVLDLNQDAPQEFSAMTSLLQRHKMNLIRRRIQSASGRGRSSPGFLPVFDMSQALIGVTRPDAEATRKTLVRQQGEGN